MHVPNPRERVATFIKTFQEEIRPVDTSRSDKPEMHRRPPSGLFLFTDDTEFDAHEKDYLSVPWVNAKGEQRTLLD